MAQKREYTISDIYQGGFSALKPNYGDFLGGYRLNPSSLGLTTDPRTANILQDASMKLRTGAKHIEISAVTPDVFESIPEKQLKEVNRLSKLTGASISVHAPIVEPSGITREGFSDADREAVERQMLFALRRAHVINPDGNIPVTFHSSQNLPGEITPAGKEPEGILVIDKATGRFGKIPLKERTFPGEQGKIDAKRELIKINQDQWDENKRKLSDYARMGGEAISNSITTNILAEAEKKSGKNLTEDENKARYEFNRGTNFLNVSYSNMKELFETAYSNGTGETKDTIKEFYNEITPKAEKIKANPNSNESIVLMKEIIEDGIEKLKQLPAPQMYQDFNDFSKEKTVETFSNIALKSYKEFGDKSPIISIENPPAGAALSTGEELKDLIEKTRDKFVEKAKAQGIDERTARFAATKFIGVTWDVGHINMLRKYGYEKEDIVKETGKVAKLVKHVHLSDNFGMEHTELPMGMGNVPTKEILEKLGKEGFDAKKIIEAGNWWAHFRTPPFKETLEAFGSPIYSMQMAPYWNQSAGGQQNYYSGYGQMLPQMNYETFGAGFSRLPMELGGQRASAEGSRMSGRAME